MNLTEYKGNAVGLILVGNIPAVCFIVVKETKTGYNAVSVLKVNDNEGEVTGSPKEFEYDDEFSRIVPLAELQKNNADGWEKFKAAYAEIAEQMEVSAST